jgi:hypothetical protein
MAPHDPVTAPPGIFLGHPHHQPLGLLVNSGTRPGFAKLRSVELVGDELSVPELCEEITENQAFLCVLDF